MSIKLFESKQVRTVWNELDEKWYFVVADVIQILTDTSDSTDYIKKMRKRDNELSKGWGQFVTPLPIDTRRPTKTELRSLKKPATDHTIYSFSEGRTI